MIPQERFQYRNGLALFATWIKMIIGSLFGMYMGLLLGRSLIVEVGQKPIDMEVPGAMLGAIVGCTLVRVFSRNKIEEADGEVEEVEDVEDEEK